VKQSPYPDFVPVENATVTKICPTLDGEEIVCVAVEAATTVNGGKQY